ncbi:MAG TPA: hypothetical protein VJ180_11750 [Pyrinomonadaceae bacterium]|nr:hypothetical protein [Pyrinomonadaceae bacterium]
MILVCLAVFGAIVAADYFVQRKAMQDALALGTPTPIPTRTAAAKPSATTTPTPVPTATPTAARERSSASVDDLEEYLEPLMSTPRTGTQSLERERQARATTPTPSDTSTPAIRPRVHHNIISAFDVLRVGDGKLQDTRHYRFRLDGIAHLKGSFSAKGGAVRVRIVSGGHAYYHSYEMSADRIDVALYPGTYELEVALFSPAVVSFAVQVTAYYIP